MKSRLEATYATILFGFVFFLAGFFGNLVANYVYAQEKDSRLFEWFSIVVFFVLVGFFAWFIRDLEKRLK